MFVAVYENQEDEVTLRVISKDAQVANYALEDPAPCFGSGNKNNYFMELILSGHTEYKYIIVVANTASTDIGIISCTQQKIWCNTILPDGFTASTPLESDQDSYPIGMALDFSNNESLPGLTVDDEAIPPSPVLWIMTDKGVVIGYFCLLDVPKDDLFYSQMGVSVKETVSNKVNTLNTAPSFGSGFSKPLASAFQGTSTTAATPAALFSFGTVANGTGTPSVNLFGGSSLGNAPPKSSKNLFGVPASSNATPNQNKTTTASPTSLFGSNAAVLPKNIFGGQNAGKEKNLSSGASTDKNPFAPQPKVETKKDTQPPSIKPTPITAPSIAGFISKPFAPSPLTQRLGSPESPVHKEIVPITPSTLAATKIIAINTFNELHSALESDFKVLRGYLSTVNSEIKLSSQPTSGDILSMNIADLSAIQQHTTKIDFGLKHVTKIQTPMLEQLSELEESFEHIQLQSNEFQKRLDSLKIKEKPAFDRELSPESEKIRQKILLKHKNVQDMIIAVEQAVSDHVNKKTKSPNYLMICATVKGIRQNILNLSLDLDQHEEQLELHLARMEISDSGSLIKKKKGVFGILGDDEFADDNTEHTNSASNLNYDNQYAKLQNIRKEMRKRLNSTSPIINTSISARLVEMKSRPFPSQPKSSLEQLDNSNENSNYNFAAQPVEVKSTLITSPISKTQAIDQSKVTGKKVLCSHYPAVAPKVSVLALPSSLNFEKVAPKELPNESILSKIELPTENQVTSLFSSKILTSTPITQKSQNDQSFASTNTSFSFGNSQTFDVFSKITKRDESILGKEVDDDNDNNLEEDKTSENDDNLDNSDASAYIEACDSEIEKTEDEYSGTGSVDGGSDDGNVSVGDLSEECEFEEFLNVKQNDSLQAHPINDIKSNTQSVFGKQADQFESPEQGVKISDKPKESLNSNKSPFSTNLFSNSKNAFSFISEQNVTLDAPKSSFSFGGILKKASEGQKSSPEVDQFSSEKAKIIELEALHKIISSKSIGSTDILVNTTAAKTDSPDGTSLDIVESQIEKSLVQVVAAQELTTHDISKNEELAEKKKNVALVSPKTTESILNEDVHAISSSDNSIEKTKSSLLFQTGPSLLAGVNPSSAENATELEAMPSDILESITSIINKEIIKPDQTVSGIESTKIISKSLDGEIKTSLSYNDERNKTPSPRKLQREDHQKLNTKHRPDVIMVAEAPSLVAGERDIEPDHSISSSFKKALLAEVESAICNLFLTSSFFRSNGGRHCTRRR